MKRILLSVPHMGGSEQYHVGQAFATNWLSTVGPNLTAFEKDVEERIGMPAVALGSGTAALHLGLRLLGVGPGDEVFGSTLTFVASCNPVRYLGADCAFLDSDYSSWNLDPNVLADALRERAAVNRLPRAVVVVHLYGQCADMDPILEICGRYQVPVLEDAAEALGAVYWGAVEGTGKHVRVVTRLPVPGANEHVHEGTRAPVPNASGNVDGGTRLPAYSAIVGTGATVPEETKTRQAGTMGALGVFSFNGNKIITTTGGGMLVSRNAAWVEKARFWSQQARDPGVAYEHAEMGYNYRMSNVLAGIGRGQLEVLDLRVQQRRAIAFRYRDAFADLPGISLMPQAGYGLHTNWLSCFLVDEAAFGCSRDGLMRALDEANVESRPVWKPMHLQPLFAGCERYGGDVAEDLFRRGICLPSSSSLTAEEQLHVVNAVRRAVGASLLGELCVGAGVLLNESKG